MGIEHRKPEMSVTTREILGKVRRMIPPMLDKFHKGQLGRVAVIGGSQDYTGAPYFSAMASARLGCDMSHVICTPSAAAVIKTYSPNLMVHPLMRQTPSDDDEKKPTPDDVSATIIDMFPRLHVLVIGPGLGRDPLMQDTVSRVIQAAREKKLPVVLDADALQLVQTNPELVKGYKEAILTPNVVEFSRIWDALGLADGSKHENNKTKQETDRVEILARALGGVTVIQKGGKDLISDGKTTLVNDLEGGKKRSGGQGDTLTGTVATFLAWRKAYLDGLWDDEGEKLEGSELTRLAAFGGSAITRECSRRAFLTRGRSLQASDLTDEVHGAFLELFGQVDHDDDDEASESKL